MAKKQPGTFKTPDGKTVTIRGDWVEDFGITDWASLQRAIKQGIGGASGINATINGVEYNLTNQPNDTGFRSAGQISVGNLTGVPTAGFLADHPDAGPLDSDNFKLFAGLVGAGLGANALMGGLGGLGAGAGELAGAGISSGAGGAGAGIAGELGAGAAGAFDMGGLSGTGIATGTAGPGTVTNFTVAGGLNAGQTAALAQAGFSPAAISALQTAAAGGAGVGGLLGGAGSLIPGIPNNVLGGIAQGVGGYLASDAQGDAYRDVVNQQNALGAPYRDLLLKSYQPGFDLMSQPGYGDAFSKAADVAARSWSAKAGNPAGNPTAQAGILSDVWNMSYLPALANYRGGLMQGGGMGLNTSGQASLLGAGTTGGGWEAIGAGLNTALNPQPSLNDLFRQFGLGGNQPNYALNIGGVRQS